MHEARRGYRCIISAYKWSRYASLSTKFLLTVQVKSLPFCPCYKFLSSNSILKTCEEVQKYYTHIKEKKKKKKRCNNTPYLYKDKEHLVNKHSNGSSLHGSLHHGGATQSPAMLMPRIHLRKLLFRIVIIAVYCPGHYW